MKPEPRYKKGDRIGGRYLVHKALMGGMGEVYLCLDLQENKPYALKTFQDHFVANLQVRALLAQEAATWVALERHPHLVQCFFYEVVDNRPCLFLEWVVGDTLERTDLQAWLRRGVLDLRQALTVAIDICHGLLHAQQKQPGLIHRDLKPANILIDQNKYRYSRHRNRIYPLLDPKEAPVHLSLSLWLLLCATLAAFRRPTSTVVRLYLQHSLFAKHQLLYPRPPSRIFPAACRLMPCVASTQNQLKEVTLLVTRPDRYPGSL